MGEQIWTVVETVGSYRDQRGAVAKAIGASLAVHTLGIGAALAAAFAIDPAGFAWAMSVLIPLGLLANAIPITPGGLGVGEAAFDSLFGLAGLSGGAEIMLAWRLFILAFGLVGLVFYLSGHRDFIKTGHDGSESTRSVNHLDEPDAPRPG